MRPAIGVTLGYDQRRAALFTLRQDYVRSVECAGGLPLVLAPGRAGDASELLDRVQGLVLTGGSDIDPELYAEVPHPKLGKVYRDRDDFEMALCREALDRDLPLLAICRGHQVLNVATGGTLYQDIPSDLSKAQDHDPERGRWESAHDVDVMPGTRLRLVLGKGRVAVNSFHHQAVRKPGSSLVVSARSVDDGVIEGIELPDRRFVVGVQWHPEAYWNRGGDFHSLFAALVQEGGA